MQPLNLTAIIVAFIGLLGTVLSAWLYTHPPQPPQSRRTPVDRPRPKASASRLFWAVAIASLALVATGVALLVLQNRISPTIGATITLPKDESVAGQAVTVQGVSTAIPPSKTIWVVVCSEAVGRYYPQNDHVAMEPDGTWSAPTFLGIPGDSGKRFQVIAVLVDRRSRAAFEAYLRRSTTRGKWPGLGSLPEGAAILDRVTVTRE